ncbi:MAG: outer membrane beta-barrel protein [Flavobacteriales bacterium]|nr:outer membrane beta-barrel protein [Flavobacteriales bacterium]
MLSARIRFIPLLFPLLLTRVGQAQGTIQGTVLDSAARTPMGFVNLVATQVDDSTRRTGGITDVEGRFSVGPLAPGRYRLKASFVGYKPMDRVVEVGVAATDLGSVTMTSIAMLLPEAEVEAMRVRAEQKGDTTQFNADAYKTAPDASAEDLLKKLPGVTSEGGTLKVQGEEVRRVLVDGKEFFGEDPNLALKSLPAEIVGRIQVFEQQSDQARFTGFDDGTGGKAINIITRPGMAHGVFGRVYAGHDATDLYSAGGNVNLMQGPRRITLVAMSNNINQQNFSDQDLLGVTGEGETRGGRGGGGRGGAGMRGGRPGGGGSGNFMVGPQGGVATTHAIGLNYGDNWGKRTEVAGSYFFNISERDQRTALVRQQILPGDSGLFYSEDQRQDTRNANHRLNLRITHKADSANTFIFTPRISLQDNRSDSRTDGLNAYPSGLVESSTLNINTSDRAGWNVSSGLLWQHSFAKKGRTFSAQADVEANDRAGDRLTRSINLFDLLTDTTVLDRFTDDLVSGHRLGGRLTWTEPLDALHTLQLNYAPSYTDGITDRTATAPDPETGLYTLLDTSLSNRFSSTFERHRGGISMRRNTEKWMLNLGVDGQYAVLTGDREFPTAFAIGRAFYNALPNAMVTYTPAKGTSLRFFYRTSTREPSIDQLQDVVDISNPLFLRTGNTLLLQSYSHNVFMRYGRTRAEKGTSFFALVGGGVTQDHIGTSSIVALNAPVETGGITIPVGGQLSRPANLDGARNLRGFFTYGLPVKRLKSNLNFNGSYTFNRLPASINGQVNLADNHSLGQGATLASNISERLDFTLGYMVNQGFVRNSIQQGADNDFISTTANFRLQWTTLKHTVLRSNMAYTRFDGLAEGIDADYLLWNASLGYKLLKDRSLEISLQCFDILGQNNSIARNITETWIEDSRTNVLGRYVMLMVTWNLRHFKMMAPAEEGAPGGERRRD